MCFGSKPPVDRSAEIARQEAAAREGKIREGRSNIDQAFSVFDPAYYDQYQQQYLDYHNPQVDEQYGDARQKLIYDLARRRMRDSTPGMTRFQDLVDAYNDRRRGIASDSLGAVNKVRQGVEQNRSDLYELNAAAADPSLASISALGRAGSLQTPPTYSPLGDLFSGFLSGAGGYMTGRQKGLPAGYGDKFAPGGSSGGGGRSGYTVP